MFCAAGEGEGSKEQIRCGTARRSVLTVAVYWRMLKNNKTPRGASYKTVLRLFLSLQLPSDSPCFLELPPVACSFLLFLSPRRLIHSKKWNESDHASCPKQARLQQLRLGSFIQKPHPAPERTQRSPHAFHLEKKVEVFAAEGCKKSTSSAAC